MSKFLKISGGGGNSQQLQLQKPSEEEMREKEDNKLLDLTISQLNIIKENEKKAKIEQEQKLIKHGQDILSDMKENGINGFTLDDITEGDGNCGTRAIIQQLEHINDPNFKNMNHEILREEVAKFAITSNDERVKTYRENWTDEEWTNLWKEQATKNNWINQDFLQIAAIYLNRDIEIWVTNKFLTNMKFLKFEGKKLPETEKESIYLGYKHKHFQSIIRKERGENNVNNETRKNSLKRGGPPKSRAQMLAEIGKKIGDGKNKMARQNKKEGATDQCRPLVQTPRSKQENNKGTTEVQALGNNEKKTFKRKLFQSPISKPRANYEFNDNESIASQRSDIDILDCSVASSLNTIHIPPDERGEAISKNVNIQCQCKSNKSCGIMLTCSECHKIQHGACYRVFDKERMPEKHICHGCSQNNQNLICSDPFHDSESFEKSKKYTLQYRKTLDLLLHEERQQINSMTIKCDLDLKDDEFKLIEKKLIEKKILTDTKGDAQKKKIDRDKLHNEIQRHSIKKKEIKEREYKRQRLESERNKERIANKNENQTMVEDETNVNSNVQENNQLGSNNNQNTQEPVDCQIKQDRLNQEDQQQPTTSPMKYDKETVKFVDDNEIDGRDETGKEVEKPQESVEETISVDLDKINLENINLKKNIKEKSSSDMFDSDSDNDEDNFNEEYDNEPMNIGEAEPGREEGRVGIKLDDGDEVEEIQRDYPGNNEQLQSSENNMVDDDIQSNTSVEKLAQTDQNYMFANNGNQCFATASLHALLKLPEFHANLR